MATILPIQSRFDKDIPQDYGNAEYLEERELLIAINDIIALSDLEHAVIEYFLDVACVSKYISAYACRFFAVGLFPIVGFFVTVFVPDGYFDFVAHYWLTFCSVSSLLAHCSMARTVW